MKKRLVASLAAAMVLGVAGSAFAAANPFVDVPANNWAYDSVKKLAKAGIVDGYSNGTFGGDKTITRYEMAQIVAKAMGNQEKANAEQKAEIKKLQAEYSDELDKLGVRLAAVEKNQANMKFTGSIALRYNSKDDMANADKQTTDKYRLRLQGDAVVDENTTATIRIASNSFNKTLNKYGLPNASQWATFGSQTNGGDTTVLDRAFLTTKMGDFKVSAGRQSLVVGTTQAIADAGNVAFDGIKVSTALGQVNATVNYGRLVAQRDVASLELSTKTGKLNYGAGYFTIKDHAGTIDTASNVNNVSDILKLQYANATYNFASNFSMTVEGGQNKAAYATKNNKFYNILAKYGAQSLAAKGDQNFIVQYYSVGANALALDSAGTGLTTLDTASTTTKFTGWDLSYNRAFSKNFSGEVHYVKIDDKATSINDYNYFRVNLIAKF